MRMLAWVVAPSGLFLILALAFCAVVDRGVPFDPPKAVPSPLPSEALKTPWRIGVLGDSQKGLANFRNIAKAVSDQDVRLLLHTGDFVANNDEGHYRLAYSYLLRGLKGGSGGLPYVTPGNHDLKAGTGRFETWCGPLEQTFVKGNVAFVLLNNAHANPPPDPRHVEERLAMAGPHQAVVLAMHQPPFDVDGQAKPEYASFLAWLEKSKVNYLMCGHVHGYLKKRVGDTTVIINGVGGDYDTWQLDQKVYGTILEVDGGTLTDRSIELEPVHEVWENIEHLATGHLREAYHRRPLVCWGGTLLLGAGVAWSIRRILAKREPFARAPG